MFDIVQIDVVTAKTEVPAPLGGPRDGQVPPDGVCFFLLVVLSVHGRASGLRVAFS